MINPMVFDPRFPHIVENILEQLDKESLKNCRQVSKKWQNYIDKSNFLWITIVNDKGPKQAFRAACINGHLKMVQMLLKEPNRFHINVNSKEGSKRRTAFHWSCENGHTQIAELIIKKSFDFDIDLNAKDWIARSKLSMWPVKMVH